LVGKADKYPACIACVAWKRSHASKQKKLTDFIRFVACKLQNQIKKKKKKKKKGINIV
jgi:allophanate hydrolase subunit 2